MVETKTIIFKNNYTFSIKSYTTNIYIFCPFSFETPPWIYFFWYWHKTPYKTSYFWFLNWCDHFIFGYQTKNRTVCLFCDQKKKKVRKKKKEKEYSIEDSWILCKILTCVCINIFWLVERQPKTIILRTCVLWSKKVRKKSIPWR